MHSSADQSGIMLCRGCELTSALGGLQSTHHAPVREPHARELPQQLLIHLRHARSHALSICVSVAEAVRHRRTSSQLALNELASSGVLSGECAARDSITLLYS